MPFLKTIASHDELVDDSDGGAWQLEWLEFPLPDDPNQYRQLAPGQPLVKALRTYDYAQCCITVEAPQQNLTVSRCGVPFDFDLDEDEDVLLGHSRPPAPSMVALDLRFEPGLRKLGARVTAFADAGSVYLAQLEVRLDGDAAFQLGASAAAVTLSSARGSAPLLAVRTTGGRRIVQARFSVRDPDGFSALRRAALGRVFFLEA